MEKFILDYIINNINKNKKEDLNEDLYMLEKMVENREVNSDYEILLNGSNEKIKLGFFLENIYKENGDGKIIDILSNDKFSGEMSDDFSYKLLMEKIKDFEKEFNPEKIKKVLTSFFNVAGRSEKIANYITKDGVSKNFNILFKNILITPESLFLFKTLFFDSLKIEKNQIESYISNNFKKLDDENYVKSLVDLCNEYAFIKKITLQNKKNNSISFVEFLVSENPDIINILKIDEEEKNALVNFYFKEKVEVRGAYFSEYHDILKMKKDWFKKKSGSKDIISILMENENLDVELFINDIEKDINLKKYLTERKENVIIEYMLNAKKIKKSMYNKLKKNLPELMEKENKRGLLNYPLGYSFYSENFNFIKDLSSQMLMTSDEQELWKWATTENLMDFRCGNNLKRELSILYYKSITENFEGRKSQLFEDAFGVVTMQNFLYDACYGVRKVDQDQLIWLMKQSKVSVEKLESVKAIQCLLSEGKLERETFSKFKAQKERDILAEIMIKKETNESLKKEKKRI